MITEIKFQIFISSTYEDLRAERETVISTILSMYHIPIGMELFSADDDEQWNTIKKTIDDSDYYLLIIGKKYGSENSEGISFTELEYNYAIKSGIPVLSFIIDDSALRNSSQIENDGNKLEKLKKFKELVLKNNKMADFWTDRNDLGRKIAIALQKTFRTNPRVGWIRSDKAASQDILREMSELSMENRHLRQQLERYSEKLDRKPKLAFRICNESIFHFSDEERLKGLLSYKKPIDYSKLDNRVKLVIPKSKIDEYNAALPTEIEIKKYNDQLEKYNLVYENFHEIKFELKNQGTLQANNIHIKIFFPREIFVVENKSQIYELKPKEINFPKSPLLEISEYPFMKNQILENRLQSVIDMSQYFNSTSSSSAIHIPSFNQNHWAIVDNNQELRFFQSKLLHTMKTVFDSNDGFYIAILGSGKFTLNYTIVCEEYPKPISGNFVIKVE